jgi:hypothetical protein
MTAAAAATVILDGSKPTGGAFLLAKTLSGSMLWSANHRNVPTISIFSRASQPRSAGAIADEIVAYDGKSPAQR